MKFVSSTVLSHPISSNSEPYPIPPHPIQSNLIPPNPNPIQPNLIPIPPHPIPSTHPNQHPSEGQGKERQLTLRQQRSDTAQEGKELSLDGRESLLERWHFRRYHLAVH